MITYSDSAETITPEQLQGFFEGWPNPPTPETHLRILKGSQHRILALDEANRVVGFITAISDGISSAYIPHLEVLSKFRGQGIGSELVRRMVEQLNHLYMIDLLCDADVQPFYARLGLKPYTGMLIRNYEHQACD